MTLELWFSYRGSTKNSPICLTIYEDGRPTSSFILCKKVISNHPHEIFPGHDVKGKDKVPVHLKWVIQEDPDDD